MFKVGDWVQITPTPDLTWNQWRTSQDIYKDFLDRIGSIENISEDDERPGESLYAVRVNFPEGLGHMGPGHYYEWFREEHLVRSSQSQANLRNNMAAAGKELQEWEKFKKKSTDNMLKHIFGQSTKEEHKKDDPNQWDLKTPTDDDKYDSYYDSDSLNYTFEYTNNTDVDYYYLSDTSDAKTKDQD